MLNVLGLFFCWFAALPTNFMQEEAAQNLVVNNRILVKVDGKALSVMDVTKRLEFLFQQQYPQYFEQDQLRYQFYMANWSQVFSTMVNNRLIVADAEAKGVKINDGEVREEMERLLGPDVVINIEKMGLSFDEMFEMIHTDLLVRRMSGMMVHMKAQSEVHPKDIRTLYDQYLVENPAQQEWTYQTISVRGKEGARVREVAKKAHHLLENGVTALELLPEALAESGVKVSVSEPYTREEKDLSLSHKAILQTLAVGSHSAPVVRERENESVASLFVVHNEALKEAVPFAQLETRLQRQLLQKAIARHTQDYVERLRTQFGLTDDYLATMIPSDFKPFALR